MADDDDNDTSRSEIENDVESNETKIILSNSEIQKTASKFSRSDIKGVLLIFPLVLLASSDGAILVGNQILIMADTMMNVILFDILVGIGTLVSGAFTFVFGYMSDKRSRKQLLLIGGGIWAISCLMFSFSPNIIFMFIFRISASAGLGSVTPVVFSLLSDMFPSEKRSNSFAWWSLATLIGGLAGGGIALAFNRINFQGISPEWETWNLEQKMIALASAFPAEVQLWRSPFLLVGILGIAFAGLLLLVKEPKRGARDKQLRNVLANDELRYSYTIRRSDLKQIWTIKSNFWLIFNFLDVVVSGFFIANLVLYIQGEMRFSFTEILDIGYVLCLVLPAVLLGLFGQFYFAKLGDKKVQAGDPAGRVKVAIMGGILHIPFFVMAFLISPFKGNESFFFGLLQVPDWAFWIGMVIAGLVLGIGLMWSFAIAPNWYASLIDVNLPEHRSTMIATASLLDTIGRSFGSIMGGIFISYFDTITYYSISTSIIWMTLIFGGISGIMWIPIYKYCNKDFTHIQELLASRAKELEAQKQ
jgi:MFS family permease